MSGNTAHRDESSARRRGAGVAKGLGSALGDRLGAS